MEAVSNSYFGSIPEPAKPCFTVEQNAIVLGGGISDFMAGLIGTSHSILSIPLIVRIYS
jgi:hypothetical protein